MGKPLSPKREKEGVLAICYVSAPCYAKGGEHIVKRINYLTIKGQKKYANSNYIELSL